MTRICDSQAFAHLVGAAFEMHDDAPALGVRRGDILIVERCDGRIFDALHVLHSGEVVRFQNAPGAMLLTRGSGEQEAVTPSEAKMMAAGRVKARCNKAAR